MALEAVLFDMDGVIVDTEPLHKKAYYNTFKELDLLVSDEMYSSFTGNSTKKVCETLVAHFSLSIDYQQIIEMKRKFFKDYFYHDTEFDLLPGVRSLIQHYYDSGIKLVLASSASQTTIEMVFQRFDLSSYFIGQISGADLQESKPHPEIFLLAADLAKATKEKCMVIEDSTNGILAAHRAGIFCAAYKSFHSVNQDYSLAQLVVSDFSELRLEWVSQYF